MFFILTTGRSGSASIAKFLSKTDELMCLHEPQPALLQEATQYIYGSYSHESMVSLLRETRPEKIEGKIYGESNQKLAFIIPALLEAFPTCKLIWLVRDGRNVVNSIYSLGWYDPSLLKDSLWQKTLVEGPSVGDVDHRQWDKMSIFSRCCWYWEFTNRCIQKQLNFLDRNRWQLHQLEYIESRLLLTFLKADINRKHLPWVNKKRKAKCFQSWQAWSESQKEEFTQICGPLMDELYPGWVDDSGEWVEFLKISQSSRFKHYLQNKLVNVKGKQSFLYKAVSCPIRLVCRGHSEVILDKLTIFYRKLSGES